MTFKEALDEIQKGKHVRRTSWNDKEIFGTLKHGLLSVIKDGKNYGWTVAEGDLDAVDWEVVQ